jgi:hypothetical protein
MVGVTFISNLDLIDDFLDDFDFLERLPLEKTDRMLLRLLADVDASSKLQSDVSEDNPLMIHAASACLRLAAAEGESPNSCQSCFNPELQVLLSSAAAITLDCRLDGVDFAVGQDLRLETEAA